MSTDRVAVKNAADEQQVHTAGRRMSRLHARRHAQLQKQLSTYDGREFVWGELERHHLFTSIVADAPQIFLLAGVHNEGLRLFAEVQQFPALYLEMQREAIGRVERDAREAEAARTTPAASEADQNQ